MCFILIILTYFCEPIKLYQLCENHFYSIQFNFILYSIYYNNPAKQWGRQKTYKTCGTKMYKDVVVRGSDWWPMEASSQHWWLWQDGLKCYFNLTILDTRTVNRNGSYPNPRTVTPLPGFVLIPGVKVWASLQHCRGALKVHSSFRF